jgi:dTDP-4-dehydrorhamnose 3,5-epimerase
VKITETNLAGVLIVEPRVHGDDRGFFFETYHADRYAEAGLKWPFVQDNYSRSVKGTLRGLHFQHPKAQGKLVQVFAGSVFDVVVDIRRRSPTFGRWLGLELSEENRRQLWIPPGFAHGFCVTSPIADLVYKCTEFYAPETEHAIAWNDPELKIDWPLSHPLLSAKDAAAPRLSEASVLPPYLSKC